MTRRRPPLTGHQREVLERLRRLSPHRGKGGWVPAAHVGSAGACARLVAKGYLEQLEESGPRGGALLSFRPAPDLSDG